MRRDPELKATIEFSETSDLQTWTCGPDRLASWDENGEYVYFLQEYNEAMGEWEQRQQCHSLSVAICDLIEAIDFRQSQS